MNSTDNKQKKQLRELSEEELKQVTGGTGAVKKKVVPDKNAAIAVCLDEDPSVCKKINSISND